MITPIYNCQTNLCFNASLKTPKMKNCGQKFAQCVNEKQTKIKEFGAKIKKEYKKLDRESKEYLYKSLLLLTVLTAMLAQIGHFIKLVMDKIHYFMD